MTILLAARRNRMDMSQTQLGVLCGLSASTISQAEQRDGPSHAVGPANFARIVQTVGQLETDQGLRPLRDYRLRERRMRLGLSLSDLAERAFFKPGQESRAAAAERQCPFGSDDIAAVRRALIWEESAARRSREEMRRDAVRRAQQESLWAAIPDSPEKAVLQNAMLARCLEFMEEGRGDLCDAIAEWLPEPAVRQMFDQWEAA